MIQAWCRVHGGCKGVTNLAVSQLGDDIVLDPHAIGTCVIRLDENAAAELRDMLMEWLG